MHWLAIALVAGTGYLWYRGGASTSDPVGSISQGFSLVTGLPCATCGAKTPAGKTGAATTTAGVSAQIPPGAIQVGT